MINKKNQRRSLILLAIATIIAIQFSACREKCRDLITEEVSITDKIRGVIVEGPWQVVVTQDSNYNSAVLEYCVSKKTKVSAQLLPNGYLHIRLSLSGNNYHDHDFRVNIQATSLEKIEVSGAAEVYPYGHFYSLGEISLSGASNVYGLMGEGNFAKIKLSGASSLQILRFDGNNIDADISGASQAYWGINVRRCSVNCSGASIFYGDGYAEETSFTGSGASNLKTFDLESENLDIDLSGASIAEVTVNNTIKGRVTGASTLKYRKATNVDVLSQGASTVMRVN